MEPTSDQQGPGLRLPFLLRNYGSLNHIGQKMSDVVLKKTYPFKLKELGLL
jgi:hypothetical protein